MRIISYDCEVFAYDWLVVFKDKDTGHYTCVWNDNEALKDCIDNDAIYVGFNSKHYDQYIVKSIASGFIPEMVKEINDFIIGGGQGWEHPLLQDSRFYFNNVDIRDDTQQGLSLKAIEGHLGMDIRESTVPFDIDRPLKPKERAEVEFYCKQDVDTAERLIDLRCDYLKNKINVGRLAGLSDVESLSMTNAKLTAALLKAVPQEHNDERNYQYPDNLLREYIPPEVFEFFDRMKDPSIEDKDLFSSKMEIFIGDCPVTLGFGGIHAAIPNFFWDEESDPDNRIRNKDVGSYYPHLCTINGYTSRNIPSPQIYADVLDRRMAAKAAGDKATANALKLVCNTTYGCLLNQYNALYDPLMGRSVCISGQLYLLELAEHCFKDIPNLEIVQLNTDGIMVKCPAEQLDALDAICEEWQNRTHFDLETDSVVRIAQKDVNNYVEVQEDGTAKAKGGYLVRGIAPAGAFNINNNACVVATALKEFFVNGTPVEKTINDCHDISQFQMIAKAGAKYKEAYHLVDGEKVPVQKVNRVYATNDERYGKLFKVKAENDSTAKIEMLPEHCIIDNNNELTIERVDKSFYIEMAKKRINDFKGVKPEKKSKKGDLKLMGNTKVSPANIYQRLQAAREAFIEANVTKSGKNMEIRYKYFELDDIVPIATKIFSSAGLIGLVNYTEEKATMTLVNTDNPEEQIVFESPMRFPNENRAINPVQALGGAQTYLRRYLYMMVLDICEPDSIEQTTIPTKPAASAAPTAKKPVAEGERKEIKQELTAPADNATDLQIKGLKKVLKELKANRPDKSEIIEKLAVQTSGFTKISKTDCEKTIQKITAMLAEKKEG